MVESHALIRITTRALRKHREQPESEPESWQSSSSADSPGIWARPAWSPVRSRQCLRTTGLPSRSHNLVMANVRWMASLATAPRPITPGQSPKKRTVPESQTARVFLLPEQNDRSGSALNKDNLQKQCQFCGGGCPNPRTQSWNQTAFSNSFVQISTLRCLTLRPKTLRLQLRSFWTAPMR